MPSTVPHASRSPSRFRWFICILLLLGTVINYIDRQILALLKPQLDGELGWTNEQYGNVNAAFQASYAISYLVFGWFIDRVGVKLGYTISVIAWSFAAFSHAFVGSVRGFLFGRLALGAGEGGNFPACIKAVASWFPPRERAFASSIFNTGSNLAAVIAPAIVPFVALRFGWQACFVGAAAAGFVWLTLWIPFYKNSPMDSRFVSPAEKTWIESGDSPTEDHAISWWQLFRLRQTWAYMAAKFLTDPVWWFFLIWLPDFFKKTRHLDLKNSWLHLVTIYGIVTVVSIVGGWLSGHLISRGWETTRARKVTMLISAFCVLPVAVAPMAPEWIAVCVIGLAGAAHQAWCVTLYAATSDIFPKKAVAAISGIGGMAGAVGGILFPPFAGALLDKYPANQSGESTGYTILFVMCALAYLVAFGVNHFLAPTFRPIARQKLA